MIVPDMDHRDHQSRLGIFDAVLLDRALYSTVAALA
jgi:hypothetical protein